MRYAVRMIRRWDRRSSRVTEEFSRAFNSYVDNVVGPRNDIALFIRGWRDIEREAIDMRPADDLLDYLAVGDRDSAIKFLAAPDTCRRCKPILDRLSLSDGLQLGPTQFHDGEIDRIVSVLRENEASAVDGLGSSGALAADTVSYRIDAAVLIMAVAA